MRFVQFIRTLFKHWWALVSSAALTVLALYASELNKTNRWLLSASCATAVLMFLVSAFLAWNDEYVKVAELEKRLADAESEDRQLERRRTRAELEGLEAQNRMVSEQRAIEELDNGVLALVKESLDEKRQRNELHSNTQAYTTEFFIAAAQKLGASEEAIRESMQRLKAANRIPTLADLILVNNPWTRL